jgi:hypothetical protein
VNLAKLKQLAKEDEIAMRSERFVRVCDLLRFLKLIFNNNPTPEAAQPVTLDDVFWAGTYEPRFLEVLPAAYIAYPDYFTGENNNLNAVIERIKQGLDDGPNLAPGVEYKKMKHWADREIKKTKNET